MLKLLNIMIFLFILLSIYKIIMYIKISTKFIVLIIIFNHFVNILNKNLR